MLNCFSGKSTIFCTSVLQLLIKVLIIRDVGATHLHIDQKKLVLSCQRYSNWFTKVNLFFKISATVVQSNNSLLF